MLKMTQERSEKKPEVFSRLKAAFRSKKGKHSELTELLQSGVDDRPGDTTLRSNRNERRGSTTIGNDQSKSGGIPNKNAAEEDVSTTLWSEAYENLRNGDKRELIITYEKVLTKMASDGKPLAFERFSRLMLTKCNHQHYQKTKPMETQTNSKIVIDKLEYRRCRLLLIRSSRKQRNSQRQEIMSFKEQKSSTR